MEGSVTEDDFEELTDDVDSYGDEKNGFRASNTSDEGRVFHTYHKWECHKAGFYATTKDGMTKEECEIAMRDLLADSLRFRKALKGVITEWKHSCEHYLTNVAMNRIAWLGQAATCYALGIPSTFRGGFSLLTKEQQKEADRVALVALNKWLKANDREEVPIEVAAPDREVDIY